MMILSINMMILVTFLTYPKIVDFRHFDTQF